MRSPPRRAPATSSASAASGSAGGLAPSSGGGRPGGGTGPLLCGGPAGGEVVVGGVPADVRRLVGVLLANDRRDVHVGVLDAELVGRVHRGAGGEVGAVQSDAVAHRARELHVAREPRVVGGLAGARGLVEPGAGGVLLGER